MMNDSDIDVLVQSLIDGSEDNPDRANFMLVPPEQTDKPTECIRYKDFTFQHISTDGIEPVTFGTVRKHAETWQVIEAQPAHSSS